MYDMHEITIRMHVTTYGCIMQTMIRTSYLHAILVWSDIDFKHGIALINKYLYK